MEFRTPLHGLEAARGARFGEYHSWEIAQDYGDPSAEYRAVREGAGVLDVCYADKLLIEDRTEQLGILSLQGPDSRKRIEEVVKQSVDLPGVLEHRTLERPS